MKTLNLQQMAVIEGGVRFLGTGWKRYDKNTIDSDPRCGGGPSLTYKEVYTVLWLEMPSLGYEPEGYDCL